MRALIWLAWAAAAFATLLTIVFDPRVFFGSGEGGGGWISFGSWYQSGAWMAFWLAILALALFGVAVASLGAANVGWRGPLLAVLLVCWALARGIPHANNASTWQRGDVGVGAWLRANGRARATRPGSLGADAFAGTWRAADGTEWRFTPNEATRVVGDSTSASAKRAQCSGSYRVGYETRARSVLDERGLETSPHAAPLVVALPADALLPVASVACSAEPWTGEFVRVGDELWLLEPYLTDAELKADTFVLRRR